MKSSEELQPSENHEEERTGPAAEASDQSTVANAASDQTATKPEDAPVVSGGRAGKWWRFKSWLGTKKGRATLAGVGLLVAAVGVIAATDIRYSVVGLVYKNHGDIKVVDSVSKQPITNAVVSLGGQSTTTDNHGVAHLESLKLGRSTLTVTKKAYKTISKPVLVPIGTPKFGSISLESSGIVINFAVTDKVSGKPLDDVTVKIGDAQAVSKDGQLRLVLLPSKETSATATVTRDGFLDASLAVNLKPMPTPYPVALVPSGKAYFLSNRSGRIDLYSSNLDGSDTQVILPGTGREDSETGVLPNIKHPNLLALVSSREGRRDTYGNNVHDLFLFDADSKKLTKIENGVGFTNYRGWLDDYLVYQMYDGSGCSSVKAYYASGLRGATLVAGAQPSCPTINTIYDNIVLYSIAGTPDSNANGLYAIKADGGSKRRLSDTPGQQVSRHVKETIQLLYYNNNLPKPQVWQSLNLGTLAATKLDNGPSDTSYRAYNESADENHAVFTDERDGKTELYLTDNAGNNEHKLTSLGSVNQFVQWINNKYVLFSSTKPDENALYIVSIDGGQPQKVADFYRGNSRTYGGGYNPQY